MKLIFTFFGGFLVICIIAATVFVVTNRNVVNSNKASTITLAGEFEILNCQIAKGWSWNSDLPGASINIEMYDGVITDKTMVQSVVANITRKDIANLITSDDGKHGFEITTPASLKDSKTHKISIIARDIIDKTMVQVLTGSPKELNCKK